MHVFLKYTTATGNMMKSLLVPDGNEVYGKVGDPLRLARDELPPSRRCYIRREGTTWWAKPLRGGDEVLVNDEPLREPRPLESGAVLRLGKIKLIFECKGTDKWSDTPTPTHGNTPTDGKATSGVRTPTDPRTPIEATATPEPKATVPVDAEVKIDQLERLLAQAQDDLEKLRAQREVDVREYNKAVVELAARGRKLEAEERVSAALRADLRAASESLSRAEDARVTADRHAKNVEADLAKARAEQRTLNDGLQKVRAQLRTVEDQLDAKRVDNATMQRRVDEHLGDLERQQRVTDHQRDLIDALKQAAVRLENEAREAARERDANKKAHDAAESRLRDELAQLKASHAELERQLAALKQEHAKRPTEAVFEAPPAPLPVDAEGLGQLARDIDEAVLDVQHQLVRLSEHVNGRLAKPLEPRQLRDLVGDELTNALERARLARGTLTRLRTLIPTAPGKR